MFKRRLASASTLANMVLQRLGKNPPQTMRMPLLNIITLLYRLKDDAVLYKTYIACWVECNALECTRCRKQVQNRKKKLEQMHGRTNRTSAAALSHAEYCNKRNSKCYMQNMNTCTNKPNHDSALTIVIDLLIQQNFPPIFKNS